MRVLHLLPPSCSRRAGRRQRGPHALAHVGATDRGQRPDAARPRQPPVGQVGQDAQVAAANQTKPLLIVHTGTGKGKSTAAFGTVLRALGHGYKVGVVQFIKGAWSTGEQKALATFGDLVRYEVAGEGFTWNTQDRARDMAKAAEAWAIAQAMLARSTRSR